jgi:hypothetical protein
LPPSSPSPGGVAAALAHAARAEPEAPFLFYRNARGHFRWLSFSQAEGLLDPGGLRVEKPSGKGGVVEQEAVELLGDFLRAAIRGDAGAVVALDLPGPASGADRDVWISWRALSDPDELALARWAIGSGAAILLEPGRTLHPEVFAWARPTVVSGSVDDLCSLADQVESLAPRFLRRRWLRQRASRLRLMLVAGPVVSEDLARVAERWRAVSPLFAPAVASFSGATLV